MMGFDGLAARMDALDLLTKESAAIGSLQTCYHINFLLSDIRDDPIFVKLISPRGRL